MVPSRWNMNSVLHRSTAHRSPPGTWLGRLRAHDRSVQEEVGVACQHPQCPDRRRAAKVCHHPDCQDLNSSAPLHLCESCDSLRHSEASDNTMHFDRHPRFDLQPQASILARNVSTRSCPPRTSPPSELDDQEGGGEQKSVGMKTAKKKTRRRHTDDPGKEWFSLKFDLSVDVNTEIVPATKKKTLSEVVAPVFERNGIELSRVDLFLDQSNTPLSLGFEAYRFGGHYLKVKARPGDELKVEQGVKDLRSLSLPNMRSSGNHGNGANSGNSHHGNYILTPGGEKAEHGSLGRRESIDPLVGQARRRKNMTEFLGEVNIPLEVVSQSGVSLLTVGPESWKNRAASRFSGFFSSNAAVAGYAKEADRAEQLQSKLQSFSLFGLPKAPRLLAFHQDSWEEEEEEEQEEEQEQEDNSLELEESWTRLLDQPEALTRRQFHQQEAIWELLQTEATYIRKLRVITDLFLRGLLSLQGAGLLVEVDPWRLVSNLRDIVRLHGDLWRQVMMPLLQDARRGRSLLDPIRLQDGFMTFSSRFQPYLVYCQEEEGCLEYMRTQLRDNDLFRTFVTWAESHKQCNRLKLADMLAKPHQRLTKYPLLLKSVLKKSDEAAQRDAISNMIWSVESFINSVNSQMRKRQERQKLSAIAARIDSYEAVEGSSEEVQEILKDFSRLDLLSPIRGVSSEETRRLLQEGALRMKEGRDSRVEVYCFLFSDLLLVTKATKRVDKVKVVRPPLDLHNVVCRELRDPGAFVLVYLNEFRTAVAAFTFQANSAPQGRSWVEAVCSAQNQLQKLRAQETLHLQERRRSRELVEEVQEEQEETGEESSTSTSSSPCLRHREQQQQQQQQSYSQSDGSTETLAVMDVDDSSDRRTPPLTAVIPSSQAPPPSPHQAAAHIEDPDAQSRSLSLDSAYGTLSPGGGGAEARTEGAESEGEESEETEEEEDDEEEESVGSSRLSVVASSRPRRWPRLHGLQRMTSLALSRSEDNLLQRLHGDQQELNRFKDQSERRERDTPPLAHSRSLTQLLPIATLTPPIATPTTYKAPPTISIDPPTPTLAPPTISVAPPTTPDSHYHYADPSLARPASEENESLRNETEMERTERRERTEGMEEEEQKEEEEQEEKEEEESPRKGACPSQQHKKLTLAQLYRIRSSLVLNSTLTASEV